MTSIVRPLVTTVLVVGLLTAACAQGEGGVADGKGDSSDRTWSADTLNIDYATYNPLSLVIRQQGWLEKSFGTDVKVTWVKSAGSNKANEALRGGALDVGSTAGSAALLARANGAPIRTVDVFSQPEWAALVVPKDSPLKTVADLKGKSVAVTKGTDPYFFLLQALDEAKVPRDSVEVQNLQHADGKAALESGAVDAWSGLDPLTAASEATAGSRLLYRNVNFNTYGFLNARESFLTESPDLAQAVVDAYEKARAWAAQNPDQLVQILAKESGISEEVARTVVTERTKLDIDPVPGEAQRKVLAVVGPILVSSGSVSSQQSIDTALDQLIDPAFASTADPARVGG